MDKSRLALTRIFFKKALSEIKDRAQDLSEAQMEDACNVVTTFRSQFLKDFVVHVPEVPLTDEQTIDLLRSQLEIVNGMAKSSGFTPCIKCGVCTRHVEETGGVRDHVCLTCFAKKRNDACFDRGPGC